jgi:hypothetical protein
MEDTEKSKYQSTNVLVQIISVLSAPQKSLNAAKIKKQGKAKRLELLKEDTLLTSSIPISFKHYCFFETLRIRLLILYYCVSY